MLPILPRSGLFMFCIAGNGRRFAELFAAAWRRLPLWVRRRMLGHWRTNSACRMLAGIPIAEDADGRVTQFLSPKIELACDEYFEACVEGGRKTSGAWKAQGHHLIFNGTHTDRMPDSVVQDLVAHELAHVHQYVCGLQHYFGTDDPTHGELELEADEMMECWGFDPESIDRWAAAEGLTKVVECKDRQEYVERLLGEGSRYGSTRRLSERE
jgi:hypothetical protein